jgi:hypothetical protein
MNQLGKEGMEILLHLNNINCDKGFKLSQAWNPTINLLQTSHTDSFNNIRHGGQKEE